MPLNFDEMEIEQYDALVALVFVLAMLKISSANCQYLIGGEDP